MTDLWSHQGQGQEKQGKTEELFQTEGDEGDPAAEPSQDPGQDSSAGK